MSLSKRVKFIYGLLIPIAILIIGMLIIANVDSGASAAEFAGLAVFFMLLISLPITIVLNTVLMFKNFHTPKACLSRGVIIPVLILILAIVYQSGLWDKLT